MLSRAAALVLVGVAFEIVGLATPVYQITDLGSLGGSVTVGSAINNLGQITGYSFTASGAQRGFIYTPGAGMTDLGTLAGKLSAGRSINNLGQVTGFSQLADNV